MREKTRDGAGRPVYALVGCMFAAQAAVIVMTPVLTRAAADLHVSTSAAGQLRTVAGLAAAITALLLTRVTRAVGLGRLLLGASVLLALASLASASAPTFAFLVLAQVPLGAAVAALTTAATLAAAEWVPPELRTRTLSWTLVGQPAAWVVGMPLAGLLGEWSWRYGWLALPLTASLAAAVLVAPRRRRPPAAVPVVAARAAVAESAVRRWLASELLANAGWAGTLVYAGALFAQSYGTSPRATGLLLALAAVAYVGGNLASRRLVGDGAHRALLWLTLVLALLDALFGLARPGAATSVTLLAGASAVAGGRTLVTSAFALGLPPAVRPAATSLRAATMQLGYFGGSLAGGSALALGGYGAVGAVMGALFLGSAAVLGRFAQAVVASLARRDGVPTARPLGDRSQ